MQPEMEAPVCLIESRPLEQLCVNPEAVKILSQITKPVVVVAIVGPSNTGKSYLMNTLARKKTDFFLTTAGQPSSKGIWMWCMPHPENPTLQLVLLDTEGLDAFEIGDEGNNIWIIALSLLLSNIFIYNSMGTIDNFDIQKLSYFIELTDDVKGNRCNFTDFFIWASDDVSFPMIIDKKTVTADKYLENLLTVKPDMSRETAQQINCIRRQFHTRKWYIFERPKDTTDCKPTPGFTNTARKFGNYICKISQTVKGTRSCAENGGMLAESLSIYLKTLKTQVLHEKTVIHPIKNIAAAAGQHPKPQKVGRESEDKQLIDKKPEGNQQQNTSQYISKVPAVVALLLGIIALVLSILVHWCVTQNKEVTDQFFYNVTVGLVVSSVFSVFALLVLSVSIVKQKRETFPSQDEIIKEFYDVKLSKKYK